jgi:hypothetical protein
VFRLKLDGSRLGFVCLDPLEPGVEGLFPGKPITLRWRSATHAAAHAATHAAAHAAARGVPPPTQHSPKVSSSPTVAIEYRYPQDGEEGEWRPIATQEDRGTFTWHTPDALGAGCSISVQTPHAGRRTHTCAQIEVRVRGIGSERAAADSIEVAVLN